MVKRPAVIGYDENRKLDTTFADDGLLILPPPFGDHRDGFSFDWFGRYAVVVDSQDRLYALGQGPDPTPWRADNDDGDTIDLLLGRFTNDASLDPTFGDGGVVNLSVLLGAVFRARNVRVVAPDRHGRLLVALDLQKQIHHIVNVLVRLAEDGSLDESFTPFIPDPGPLDFINDVASDDQDRIIVLCGRPWPNDSYMWAAPDHLAPTYRLERLLADGTVDSSDDWDPSGGDMWQARTDATTYVHDAWSIAVSGQETIAWGATTNASIPADVYSTFLHRFGSGGRGFNKWFDESLRTSGVSGWSNAPGFQEESWRKRLLVRDDGGPVTFGRPHLHAPSAKPPGGYVLYMRLDGRAESSPVFVRNDIVDALVVKNSLVALLCDTGLGVSLVGALPGALAADWGSLAINLKDWRSRPFELAGLAESFASKFKAADKGIWTTDEFGELKRRMVADKTVFEWEGEVEPINLAKTGGGSRVFAAVRLEMPET